MSFQNEEVKDDQNHSPGRRERKAKLAAGSKINNHHQLLHENMHRRRAKEKVIVYIPLYIHDERLKDDEEVLSSQEEEKEISEKEDVEEFLDEASVVEDMEEEIKEDMEEDDEDMLDSLMLSMPSDSDASIYEATDTDDDDEEQVDQRGKKRPTKRAIDESKETNATLFRCVECELIFTSRGSFNFHLRQTHNQQKIPVKSRELDTKNKDFIPDLEEETIEDITIQNVETQSQNQPKISTTAQYTSSVDLSPEPSNEMEEASSDVTIPTTIPATRLPYYCHLCNKLELNEIRFQLHKQLYHSKSASSSLAISSSEKEKARPNTYQCDICKVVKPNRRSYLKHLSIIHKQVPST